MQNDVSGEQEKSPGGFVVTKTQVLLAAQWVVGEEEAELEVVDVPKFAVKIVKEGEELGGSEGYHWKEEEERKRMSPVSKGEVKVKKQEETKKKKNRKKKTGQKKAAKRTPHATTHDLARRILSGSRRLLRPCNSRTRERANSQFQGVDKWLGHATVGASSHAALPPRFVRKLNSIYGVAQRSELVLKRASAARVETSGEREEAAREALRQHGDSRGLKRAERTSFTLVQACLEEMELLVYVSSFLDDRSLMSVRYVTRFWWVAATAVLQRCRPVFDVDVLRTDVLRRASLRDLLSQNVQPIAARSVHSVVERIVTKLEKMSAFAVAPLDDAALRRELWHRKDLTHLLVPGPHKLSTDTLFRVLAPPHSGSKLTSVDLSRAAAFTPVCLRRIMHSPLVRLKLEGLAWEQLSCNALATLLRASKTLRTLSLRHSDVSSLNDSCLFALAAGPAKAGTLRDVLFGGCAGSPPSFTPSGLVYFAKRCPSLVRLQLPVLENLQFDSAIANIVEHCPRLAELEWQGTAAEAFDRGLTGSGLKAMSVYGKRLSVIKLRPVSGARVTTAVLKQLCLARSSVLRKFAVKVIPEPVSPDQPSVVRYRLGNKLLTQGLAACTRLRHLTLAGLGFSARALRGLLSKATALETLKVSLMPSMFVSNKFAGAFEGLLLRLTHITLYVEGGLPELDEPSGAHKLDRVVREVRKDRKVARRQRREKRAKRVNVFAARMRMNGDVSSGADEGDEEEVDEVVDEMDEEEEEEQEQEQEEEIAVAEHPVVALLRQLAQSCPLLMSLKLTDGVRAPMPSSRQAHHLASLVSTCLACVPQVRFLHVRVEKRKELVPEAAVLLQRTLPLVSLPRPTKLPRRRVEQPTTVVAVVLASRYPDHKIFLLNEAVGLEPGADVWRGE